MIREKNLKIINLFKIYLILKWMYLRNRAKSRIKWTYEAGKRLYYIQELSPLSNYSKAELIKLNYKKLKKLFYKEFGDNILESKSKQQKENLINMKKEQKKEVDDKIKSIADDIAKSTSKVGDTNETYDKRKEQAEVMLFNLCEMYKIAHS